MVMAPQASANRNAPQATWLTEAQQRKQPVGSIPYDGGSGTWRSLDLPLSGYVSALQSVVTISGTLSGVPTGVDPTAYVNGALGEFNLRINTEGDFYDLDGFQGALVTALDDQYNNGQATFAAPGATSFSFNPGTNAFANKYRFRIPLGLQLQNLQAPLGLYNTALQNLTVTARVRWLPTAIAAGLNPTSGLYTYSSTVATVSNQSGQIDFNEEYFEPIPVQSAVPPLRYIHRWTQFRVPIGVTNGPVYIPLPGRQRYLRILYSVFDGASSTTIALAPQIIQNLKLQYGVQSSPYDETYNQIQERMQRTYGKLMDSWPAGVVLHDFLTAEHNSRDFFNAGQTINLQAVLQVANAHPASGSYVDVATEELLTLQAAGFMNTAAQLQASATPTR